MESSSDDFKKPSKDDNNDDQNSDEDNNQKSDEEDDQKSDEDEQDDDNNEYIGFSDPGSDFLDVTPNMSAAMTDESVESVESDESVEDTGEARPTDPFYHFEPQYDVFIDEPIDRDPTLNIPPGQEREQFLEDFYKASVSKVEDFDRLVKFLTNVMKENYPNVFYGIDNPRMIGDGIKFIIDELKSRFEKYRIMVADYEEDEVQLSNEEVLGKIIHHRKKIQDLYDVYANEITQIKMQNFVIRDQNLKLKKTLKKEEVVLSGQYTIEQYQNALRRKISEAMASDDLLYQAKGENSILLKKNAELINDLAMCHEDIQQLNVQLNQSMDVNNMFNEAIKSVLQDSDEDEPSSEASAQVVKAWKKSLFKAIKDTGGNLQKTLDNVYRTKGELAQKESEAISLKEKLEEVNHEVELLNYSSYSCKLTLKELQESISSMKEKIKLDNKYCDDMKKLYDKYKKLSDNYMKKSKGSSSASDMSSPISSSPSPKKYKARSPRSPKTTAFQFPPVQQQEYMSPMIKPRFIDPDTPSPRSSAGRSAYSSTGSPMIKSNFVDYETPSPTSPMRDATAFQFPPVQQQEYMSPMIKPRFIDPDTPSPRSSAGRGAYSSTGSPMIKSNFVDYETPSPTSPMRDTRFTYSSSPLSQVGETGFDFSAARSSEIGPASPTRYTFGGKILRHKKRQSHEPLDEFPLVLSTKSPSYPSDPSLPVPSSYMSGTPQSRRKPKTMDPSTADVMAELDDVFEGYSDSGIPSPKIMENLQQQTPQFKTPQLNRNRYGFAKLPHPWAQPNQQRVAASPNSITKSLVITSPGRKDPMLVDVEVDPKPLKKTSSGEHFVCDISVNMQDIGKLQKGEIPTRKRRRRMDRRVDYGASPPPLTVAQQRRPRGIFSPRSAFKQQLITRKQLFGEGYQSPEAPWGTGQWHDDSEYPRHSPIKRPPRDDTDIPWGTDEGVEPAVVQGSYIPSGATGTPATIRSPDSSLSSSMFSPGNADSPYYQTDRLSVPHRKTKFLSPSGRPIRISLPGWGLTPQTM